MINRWSPVYDDAWDSENLCPNCRRNPDELSELEMQYQLSHDPKDWTQWAVAADQRGLPMPPPPDNFCPGFRIMTQDEIAKQLQRAYENDQRIEAVFAPEHGVYYGYIRDWPQENVRESLPHWTKIRFWVGRSTGSSPIFLLLPLRTSSGGMPLSPEYFVYIRLLPKPGNSVRRP